ncbi:cytochrome protein [Aspergillus piperis CBS 112811]|uniref:Cytochrome protein n=1 Tax=Aspergillus piperis CBS 112811 TaxID=1448313 RepID=A0A8G1QYM6_9EURO|nr:cytochrome protein [Aspergillus piperis CBS 112811]RAH55272.1 cytochrome protein [Aspergillus piperis CBS 112811]
MQIHFWAACLQLATLYLLLGVLFRKLRTPPTDKNKDPILGLDRFQKLYGASQTHSFLSESYRRFQSHGATFRAFLLTSERLYTVDPKNIQTILSTNARDYCIGQSRIRALRPLLGGGALAATGKPWKRSRILLKHGLTRIQAVNYQLYERHFTRLLEKIRMADETVDLQELFFSMTMDTICEILFGQLAESSKTSGCDSPAEFCRDYDQAQAGALHMIKWGRLTYLSPLQKFRVLSATTKSRAFVKRLAQNALNTHESEAMDKPLPDSLLKQLTSDTSDERELVDQLFSVLVGGRDTTASLLSIQFHILARRPDIWAKLRDDVAALNGKPPSIQEIRRLKYVSSVVKETLRLYPAVPRSARVAVKDTLLPTGGGRDGNNPILVAKGQTVVLDLFSLHRNKNTFGDDAEEFRPERWDGIRPGWGYIPFGGGPRLCIGQQMGFMQAMYTTVRMVQHFDRVCERDPHEWQELLTFTCASKHGTKVALHPDPAMLH